MYPTPIITNARTGRPVSAANRRRKPRARLFAIVAALTLAAWAGIMAFVLTR